MQGINGWSFIPGINEPKSVLASMYSTRITDSSVPGCKSFCESEHVIAGSDNMKMMTVNGSHHIAFSGQIAYKSSESERRILDANEISRLYEAHSQDLVKYLSGHFLLVIQDHKKSRTLLITDRMGTQACYYSVVRDGIVFSSSLASLVRHPKVSTTLDQQAIYDYMYFHCIPSPTTVYKGVRKLRPAEMLTFERGNLRLDTYWLPDYSSQSIESNDKEFGSRLITNLESAVTDSLSDSKTGAFLSGGLDSSTVAGIFSRVSKSSPVDTFTIGFDVPGYDESEYARISSQHFNTSHHEYYVTPKDVSDIISDIASAYDEPFGNSSVVPTYFCAKLACESGIDTLLAGDGGDELFAGNERYVRQKIFDYYHKLPALARSAIDLPYGIFPQLKDIYGTQKLHSYITQAKVTLPDRLQSYNFLHRINPLEIFKNDYLDAVDMERPLEEYRHRYNQPNTNSTLQRMLYLDWKFTLADNDLVKVNTMCEMAGVSVRYPMLDDRLVDLSIEIPDKVLMPRHKLRDFYKKSMHGFLAEETLSKSKHGFGLPFGVWMREHQNLQDIAYDSINTLKNKDYFKPEFLDLSIKMHREGTAGYYGELVWLLMMLELWLSSH